MRKVVAIILFISLLFVFNTSFAYVSTDDVSIMIPYVGMWYNIDDNVSSVLTIGADGHHYYITKIDFWIKNSFESKFINNDNFVYISTYELTYDKEANVLYLMDGAYKGVLYTIKKEDNSLRLYDIENNTSIIYAKLQ